MSDSLDAYKFLEDKMVASFRQLQRELVVPNLVDATIKSVLEYWSVHAEDACVREAARNLEFKSVVRSKDLFIIPSNAYTFRLIAAKPLELTKELSISQDVDGYPEELEKTVPVFLFVPKSKDDHYHLMLTRDKALELRNWLDEYLRYMEFVDVQ